MSTLLAFILGQISIVILFFAFITFFIFGDAPPSAPRPRRHSHSLLSSSTAPRSLRRKRSTVLRSGLLDRPVSPSTILTKTFYNVRGHQPESLDWFNVLVAQALARVRAEALHDDALLKSLTAVLNGPGIPDYVGGVAVTELSLGEEFPIFSNCRIIPVDESGAEVKNVGQGTRLLARLDVDLSDALTLGVETKLALNFPFKNVAVLPAALTVEVVRFSATLSLSFIPSVPEKDEDSPREGFTPSPGPTILAFSFLPDYRLDLSVRSLLGSRSRLQDVPKIAQLVEARLHAWMSDRCVEPRYQQIVLPSIWPRRKNTRGGDQEVDENEEGDETIVESREAGDVTPGAQSQAQDVGITLGESAQSPGRNEGMRQRMRPKNSTEDLRIPGQFH